MTSAKQKRKPQAEAGAALSARVGELSAAMGDTARAWLAIPLAVATLVGGWYWAWHEVQGYVLGAADYQIGIEHIEVTPPPAWIHRDLRAEVFAVIGGGRPLSLMDPQLCQRVAAAFALQPWIESVVQVRKHYPGRLHVEVKFRRPVLIVECTAGLLPVDGMGVLLPGEDFSPVERSRFPLLPGPMPLPLGAAGDRWGDGRVVGAAAIAAAIAPAAEKWQIARIVSSPKPATPGGDDYLYYLETRGGTRIYWGRPPYALATGELPTNEKLRRIEQYAAAHGTLEGHSGPQNLDLGTLPAAPSPPAT